MSEMRVYISADYSENSGDRVVVNTLNKWSEDKLHKVSFVDMAKVVSGKLYQRTRIAVLAISKRNLMLK